MRGDAHMRKSFHASRMCEYDVAFKNGSHVRMARQDGRPAEQAHASAGPAAY